MESAGLRRRSAEKKQQDAQSGRSTPDIDNQPSGWAVAGHEPPRYTVDLSVSPEHRYDHIVQQMKSAIQDADVASQFDELVSFFFEDMPLTQKCIHGLVRVSLRRVHSDEETAELRGIARAAGLPMHLLVALNVMLDLLLGCTSGGVRYRDTPDGNTRMVHFRTLDWDMDPLRSLVVELDYVQRAGGPVIATTVGYLGYVGVLTGVRPGLSMSLNYRPHHDKSTLRQRLSFRWHQVMVVLGRRPSISSTLRSLLLPSLPDSKSRSSSKSKPREIGPPPPDITSILSTLSSSPSTAAYLILCTPSHVYSVEKDHRSSSVSQHDHFLATCNHDLADELDPQALVEAARRSAHETGMDALVEDSIDRKTAVTGAWNAEMKRTHEQGIEKEVGVGMDGVLRMVGLPGISNEMTHYAVVMDPERGGVLWRRAYELGELGEGSDSD